MDAMSVFGTVIGGLLGVMLAPLVTLNMAVMPALIWGFVVAAACIVLGRAAAHFVLGPMLGAPGMPGTLVEKIVPGSWLELVFSGGFVVMALVIGIIARQGRAL